MHAECSSSIKKIREPLHFFAQDRGDTAAKQPNCFSSCLSQIITFTYSLMFVLAGQLALIPIGNALLLKF